MDISKQLNFLIQQNAIPLNQLAEQCGVNAPTLLRLKTGELSDPKISVVNKIATYFNISIEQLIGKLPLFEASAQRTH